MKSLRFWLLLSMVSFLLVACSGEAAPATGPLQDFASVCDKTNDGKVIGVEGYLRFPDSFSGDQSVVLRLYPTSDFNGTPIGVTVELGSKPNQAEPVSDQYTDNDLKVHLADGTIVPFGTKVKISGKMYYPLVEQVFDCALDNPYVEATTQ